MLGPVRDAAGTTRLAIDLHGALASLPCLATCRPLQAAAGGANTRKAPGGAREAFDLAGELVLVKGARFQKYSPLYQGEWTEREQAAA